MIYITGDMHGDERIGEIEFFIVSHPDATYLIILGDFGAIWNEETSLIERLSALPTIILFIDGNHENFDLLNAYPREEWNGGYVHHIANNILHLMRGNIYEIENRTFFVFGGAVSADKNLRKEGVSWWPQEEATECELNYAQSVLQGVKKVDYVLTHCGNMEAVQKMHLNTGNIKLKVCWQSIKISTLLRYITYSIWFCGHYHLDCRIGKYIFLYKTFYRLKEENTSDERQSL